MPRRNAIDDPRRTKAAPIEYAGQWVAWNKEQTEIVAHGTAMVDVCKQAIAAGYPDAILQKVREPGIFIGPM